MDPRLRKKSAKRYIDSLQSVRDFLNGIENISIEHLIRCTEEVGQIDGFPLHMSPDEDDVRQEPQHAKSCPHHDGRDCECGAVMISDGTNRSVEVAAIQLAEGRTVADPLRDAALESLAILTEISGLVNILARKIPVVTSAGDKHRGRKSTVSLCMRCGGPVSGAGADRIKSGMGPVCYERWRYLGKPERDEFLRSITEEDRRCGEIVPITEAVSTSA